MSTPRVSYLIRVEGHLDDHWCAWLGELDMTLDDDGTTTVIVSVADQAQLHGVLAGIRDIGAVLIEVRPARHRDGPLAHRTEPTRKGNAK